MCVMNSFTRRIQRATATSAAPSSWPDATNTGYSGTLTEYTGSRSIHADITITDQHIAPGGFQIFSGATVTFINCWIETSIDADYGDQLITLTDCQLDAGATSAGAIAGSNLRITRCNITGGQHSVHAGSNCIVQDSWLHDQYGGPEGSAYHNNAFISNGGSDLQIIHNRLDCSVPENGTGGGPTADASIFGDWAPMTNVLFDNNLFMPTTGGYGGTFGYNPAKTYGSNPTYIVVQNNVFQRGTSGICGVYGPVTSFLSSGTGNVWSNNRYEDETPIPPAE